MKRRLSYYCLAPFLLALLVAGCHQVQAEHSLVIRVSPSPLEVGSWVKVTVAAQDRARLSAVSGTVEVGGAPVYPLRFDPKTDTWGLQTMLPVFLNIPAGKYKVKAWGSGPEGTRYQGETTVEVK